MVKVLLLVVVAIILTGCASSFGNSDMSQYQNTNSFKAKGKL